MGAATAVHSWPQKLTLIAVLAIVGLGVVILCWAALFYTKVYLDEQGPYRSLTNVADLDGDGDLDVVVARTRWEDVDISWPTITLWLNQGDGDFVRDDQKLPGGFATAVGDVDGDKDTDLLVLDGDELTLAFNLGGIQGGDAGTFGKSVVMDWPLTWRGHVDMGGAVNFGDLNDDHVIDAFISGCCYGKSENPLSANSHVPSAAWVWFAEDETAGQSASQAVHIPDLDGVPMQSVALGDLDSDGDLDVFAAVGAPSVGASSSLSDLVLLNDGEGNFTSSGQTLGATASNSVALGDVDGDGDLDALVGTGAGAFLWFNLGDEQADSGLIFDSDTFEFPFDQVKSVFLSDLEGDGDLDVLIAGPRQAEVYWNLGGSVFTQTDLRFRYAERDGLAVADFNGDGLLDIFAGANQKNFKLWLNQGDGTFKRK